ncbi:hypothetical protein C3L33_23400, partial [Rhododendron williamsianum]
MSPPPLMESILLVQFDFLTSLKISSSMAASSSIRTYIPTPPFLSPRTPQYSLSSSLKLTSPHFFLLLSSPLSPPLPLRAATTSSFTPSPNTPIATFHGLCYVVGDNIDTDQIVPAEYLTLVPFNPDEYKKLGSYAFIGLPAAEYPTRFIAPNKTTSKYSILIAGDNFGCGSSREHAPVALGVAGVAAMVAELYARIFFQNSLAIGEVYPLESRVRVCEACRTGDVVTIELGLGRLINHTPGRITGSSRKGMPGRLLRPVGFSHMQGKLG